MVIVRYGSVETRIPTGKLSSWQRRVAKGCVRVSVSAIAAVPSASTSTGPVISTAMSEPLTGTCTVSRFLDGAGLHQGQRDRFPCSLYG